MHTASTGKTMAGQSAAEPRHRLDGAARSKLSGEGPVRWLSFAKTMAGAETVDLAVLIQTQSRLDDHSPAPSASTVPLPLRRPPAARGREPCPAATARRVQENDGPTQAAHDRSPLLDLAGQGLARVEAASRDRDPRHRPAVAAAPLLRVLDQALRPPDRRSPSRPCRDQGFDRPHGHREPSLGRSANPWRAAEARYRRGRAHSLPAHAEAAPPAVSDLA